MQLLCPSCRTPLPATPPGRAAVLTCDRCSAEVDVSRAGTAAGRPRFVPEIDRSGDTVGGFVLEGRIGAGGMGTVYRARRPGDAGPVALKFLSPALASEPDVVARFHREVKLLRSLEHPSIVRVIDHGDEAGVPWFAMELVDGPDLRARLAQGPLGLEETGRVFGRLFEALAHAHSKGVIHRDLKPANVLLAAEGAKLADFGIARPDPDALSNATRLTETAAVLGTFPYMSPEQRAGAEVDRRSDLFSVGVLLYEALTGRLPQGAFAPPSRMNPALPARLDAVVSKLLQPDRESRYDSASDAALAFQDAIRPRPSMAPVIGFGGIAAILIALVVPAVMQRSGGSAPGKKLGATAATPTALAQAAATAAPQSPGILNAAVGSGSVLGDTGENTFSAMNAGDVFPQDFGTRPAPQAASKNGMPTGTPFATPAAENAKAKPASGDSKKSPNRDRDEQIRSKSATSKVDLEKALKSKPAPATPETTPVPEPDAKSQAAYSGNLPGNRTERNLVQSIERQAQGALPEEIVGMVTACGPTFVYDKAARGSKIVTKLPKGHPVDRLRTYTRLASHGGLMPGVILAGMPAPKKSSKRAEAAPPQTVEPQKAPEEVWFFVRYNAKDDKGWIPAECTAVAASTEPAYQGD